MWTECAGAPSLVSGVDTVDAAAVTVSVPLDAVEGIWFSFRSCWVSVIALAPEPIAWKTIHTTSPDPDRPLALNIEICSVPGELTLETSVQPLVYAVRNTPVGVTFVES